MNETIERVLAARASLKGSKSTVLLAVQWMFGLLVSALAVTFRFAPEQAWIVFLMLGVTFWLFIGAYLYCLKTNPDLLRSEKYAIDKMMIEKGVRGDSTTGFFVSKSSDKAEIPIATGDK